MSDVRDGATASDRPGADLVQAIADAIREIIRRAEGESNRSQLYSRALELRASCVELAVGAQPPRPEAMVTSLLHRLLYREARRIWLEAEAMARRGAADEALARHRLSVRVSGVGDALRGPLAISRLPQAMQPPTLPIAGRQEIRQDVMQSALAER